MAEDTEAPIEVIAAPAPDAPTPPVEGERSDAAFAADVDPTPAAPEPWEPPALEGTLVEVRYSGVIDEVELVMPNGARGHVKTGGYLKTTQEHADALTLSDVWNAKGAKG